jgi:hypothetical protein
VDETIKKAATVTTGTAPSEEQLGKINKLSIKELGVEDVFLFRVAMCDNEVDRAFEVFPRASLNKMAGLFIGKTVISDHSRRSGNQVARIFDAYVEEKGGTTKSGEPYAQLIAECYMLRTEGNKDLISEIEAGIKKEVSVSCGIKSAVCSICGTDNRKKWCEHYPGREYEKQACYFKLENPSDAYELSFVAVPCQPAAGVTKSYGTEKNEPDLEKEKQNSEDTILKTLETYIFIEKEQDYE